MEGGLGGKSELLNLLGDVKARVQDKLGVVDFPMPQFILIGKQSVGKSRLIEAMAGETFNFISGSLGSRRPTVLEFRNVSNAEKARWFVRDMDSLQWKEHPVTEVMTIVGSKHEELGEDVSSDPIYVRIESPGCVDMQIVDLPGFRDFALDDAKQRLAKKIEDLDRGFMADRNNVILCVEQCGDAATMSSLQRAREYDPDFARTILIRNKLDKYYNDLTIENASAWVDGHGDLPTNLIRFALTLPWWKEGQPAPKSFPQLTTEMNDKDMSVLGAKGLTGSQLQTIGFRNFVAYMEKRIEQMFVQAINPVLDSLKAYRKDATSKKDGLKVEFTETDPNTILNTTRECGNSFAEAVEQVMDGVLDTKTEWTLEEELVEFHRQYENNEEMDKLPSTDFAGLGDYMEYLQVDVDLATYTMKLNGGAQFRRMMQEVEIFLRFSELGCTTKKKDVIQALGVAMTSITWRDVIVKLLGHEAHLPLKKRLRYVGERIRFFFQMQKECTLEFMASLEGKAVGAMHSTLLIKHVKLIRQNEMIKHLLFEAYDNACQRQLNSFLALFADMLTSTFSNPWVFMKGATVSAEEEEAWVPVRDEEETKERIPEEIEKRSGTEGILAKWINQIPTETDKIDEAVDKVQMLVLKTYSFIRSHVCDQVELLTETFFKVPMLRRLKDDMRNLDLSAEDKENYKVRRETLSTHMAASEEAVSEIEDCVKKLETFKIKRQAMGKF